MAKKEKPAPKERTLRGYETPSPERGAKSKKPGKAGKAQDSGSARTPRRK